MIRPAAKGIGLRHRVAVILAAVFLLPALSGCLEQVQSPRIPSGAVSNFLLHLEAGELDDARAYFAPGLFTPGPALNNSIESASIRVRRYEVQRLKSKADELGNGDMRVTLSGRVRPITPAGKPTPTADEGWESTDIITARVVERGPGWRILDFELKCCP